MVVMSMVNGGNNSYAPVLLRGPGCAGGGSACTMLGSRPHRRITDHADGEGHQNHSRTDKFAHRKF